MNFINPETDFAFKRIFGSEQSKNILISFLNTILYAENPVIIDLEVLTALCETIRYDKAREFRAKR
jgi:hypothetical protein